MARKMKPVARILMFLILAGIVLSGLFFLKNSGVLDNIVPKGNQAGTGEIPKGMFKKKAKKGDDVIDIAVVPWGGYAGGQYANKSFNPSEESEYFAQFGIKVRFHNMPEIDASLAAWKSRTIDLHWYTFDAYPVIASGLVQSGFFPKMFFQADWSRGGDAFVVTSEINSVNDLFGKKIAVAFGTPSHTFLIYALDAAGLSYSDVEIIEVKDAIDAAAAFNSGRVDGAIVWSPDDALCMEKVPGSKVLMSTKKARYIIADGFFAHQDYLESNREKIKNFIRVWMGGVQALNGSDQAKQQAAQILSNGFGSDFDVSFCYDAINNVRLCNYGDNAQFFELQPWEGMTGRKLYNKMGKIYKAINLIRGDVPNWHSVVDVSFLKELSDLSGSQPPEGKKVYTKVTVKESRKMRVVAKKEVSISFPTGKYTLEENAKTIIDYKFKDIALMSSNRIRIEGNTDNTGSRKGNLNLSLKRARSAANYLNELGIDPNRMIVVGNGPDKPVAKNGTESGRRKNRRTDFVLLDN